MIIKTNEKLRSPIVYVGSGYNNYLAAAVGGEIKERPLGVPDIAYPIIKESADEVDEMDVTCIEDDPVVQNIRTAARLVSAAIGDEVIVSVTSWGPFTLAGQMYDVERFMKAQYKKKEEWLSNGDWVCVVEIPAAMKGDLISQTANRAPELEVKEL